MVLDTVEGVKVSFAGTVRQAIDLSMEGQDGIAGFQTHLVFPAEPASHGLSAEISQVGLLEWVRQDRLAKIEREARAEIMEEYNLAEADLSDMTASQKMEYEAKVVDRTKEKLIQALKDSALEKLESEKERLYRPASLIVSEDGNLAF